MKLWKLILFLIISYLWWFIFTDFHLSGWTPDESILLGVLAIILYVAGYALIGFLAGISAREKPLESVLIIAIFAQIVGLLAGLYLLPISFFHPSIKDIGRYGGYPTAIMHIALIAWSVPFGVIEWIISDPFLDFFDCITPFILTSVMVLSGLLGVKLRKRSKEKKIAISRKTGGNLL